MSYGSKSITLVSSDTDVIVLDVSVFNELLDVIWIAFGKGKDFCIPVLDITRSLGPRSRLLHFFIHSQVVIPFLL